jgi:DNA-binding phage protein
MLRYQLTKGDSVTKLAQKLAVSRQTIYRQLKEGGKEEAHEG